MSLDTIAFLGIHVCISNPCWQSSGIIIKLQILCSYLIYTDRLLDVFFLLLAVILSELHENPRRKVWVTEKSTPKNLCEGHHFFGCTPSFLCHSLSPFSSTHSLSSTPILCRKKNFAPKKSWEGRSWRPHALPMSTTLFCFQKKLPGVFYKKLWMANCSFQMAASVNIKQTITLITDTSITEVKKRALENGIFYWYFRWMNNEKLNQNQLKIFYFRNC